MTPTPESLAAADRLIERIGQVARDQWEQIEAAAAESLRLAELREAS